MAPTPMERRTHPFPLPGRRRVLVEDPSPVWRRVLARVLSPDDYELDFCPGPGGLSDGCPVVAGRPCPRAQQADVILNSLDLEDHDNRAVLQGLRRLHPHTPLWALVTRAGARRYPSCLHGCRVVFLPLPVHDLPRLAGPPPSVRSVASTCPDGGRAAPAAHHAARP